MKLTVIGCSDAFNSGGRLNSCYHVAVPGRSFLVDCGANTLMGLEREGLDPNGIGLVFITHLHGDHFAGLVWWLIHANHVSKRLSPLVVAGPAGLEERFNVAAEALFPGSTMTPRKFDLKFVALTGASETVDGVRVVPFEVNHPSGATAYALRFEVGDKTISFSGDTGWVESLIPAASGADLFVCECFGFEREMRVHLSWRTIESNLDRLGASKVLLTHFGPEMLVRCGEVRDPRVLLAEDGLALEV